MCRKEDPDTDTTAGKVNKVNLEGERKKQDNKRRSQGRKKLKSISSNKKIPHKEATKGRNSPSRVE